MPETLNQFGIPEHYVRTFTSNVRMALQRRGGTFRSLVTGGGYQGEGAQAVNYIGGMEFSERETRWADTKLTEPEHTQRWVFPIDYDAATLVDRIDRLRTLYDPTNPYVEALRLGAARREDDAIINAFFNFAFTGKNGAVPLAFDTTKYQIAHGGTGLTVAKLREARKMLLKNHVDLDVEMPMIAVSAEEMDDLLGETSVTSADFNTVKALVNGEVDTFMGFKFVKNQGLLASGSPVVRRIPVWVRSGMHFGDWQNLQVLITPRADKNNIPQIHGSMTFGSVRVEEGKVLEIQCQE